MAKNPLDAYKNAEKFQSILSSKDEDNPAVSILKQKDKESFKPIDLSGGKAFISKDRHVPPAEKDEYPFEAKPISVEKVTIEKRPTDSILRRVAKFIFLIGSDKASKILPLLPKEDVKKIIAELATIQTVTPDEQERILNEFESLVKRTPITGGLHTAKQILTGAFGEERANALMEKHASRTGPNPFDEISDFSCDDLFEVLKNEPISVKSLVISQLKPNLAATLLKKFNPEEKVEIVQRIAKIESIDSRVLRRLGNAILQKTVTVADTRSNSLDGKGILSEILRQLPADSENLVLQQLQVIAPEIEEDLRARLFVLDDILGVDDEFLQKKLELMDDIQIAFLIADKTEKFRQKILDNLSKNRQKDVLEEEILKKPMRKKDVDSQTTEFFETIRRAWEAGEVKITGRDEDDEWIM